MPDRLEYVRGEVAVRMDEIKRLFVAGAKISVLVRFPEFPLRDFMMTDDDLSELHLMLDRRADQEHATKQDGSE